MTPLEKFIDESQRICDRSPGVLVLGGCSGRMITTTTGYIGDGFIADVDTKENAEFLVNSCTALPAALQHLRELSKERDKLKLQLTTILDKLDESDALTRRVAELEAKLQEPKP